MADIEVVCGAAPAALTELPRPDADFIAGGLTADGMLEAWQRLAPGGRLVARAVTVESEAAASDRGPRQR